MTAEVDVQYATDAVAVPDADDLARWVNAALLVPV